jgi:FdrA protein
MRTQCFVQPSTYRDSVTLMAVARELTRLAGVADAAVVMATQSNQAILQEAGLLLPEIAAAGPNDLVVVVRAESAAIAEQALEQARQHLERKTEAAGGGAVRAPRTLRAARRAQPDANLAVVSVAGEFAAAEAWDALLSGLHVLLFSDNVSLTDEVALKEYAVEHGLLLMGPGCGTALLDGVALGFANVVPRGPVGIVAAAGTGLQEVSTLLAKSGIGVSQGIGTGGRDLSEAVGGVTMRQGIRLLQQDPQTQVLLLISKPPAPAVAARILEELPQSPKPTVVCFLGGDPAPVSAAGATPAQTLQEAVYLAAEMLTVQTAAKVAAAPEEYQMISAPALARSFSARSVIRHENAALRGQADELRQRLRPGQQYLRGLYSGGTLLAEAQVVWRELGLAVYSNAPLDKALKVTDPARSQGHCALDLGEEEFTVGRPHPMIDQSLRIRRLLQEAADPEVAVLLLDVVLGYGAHPDPAGELGPAVYRARSQAAHAGRDLLVVTSVTGTEADPQGLSRQVRMLGEAGAIVAPCNAAAARLAGEIVRREA